MASKTQSAYERRVTLALKWHHLDNLTPPEIQEKFREEMGVDLTARTIRGYLNSEPAEEVLDQIRGKHAEVRLQILEREEQAYQRARRSEENSTRDEPIIAMRPRTDKVDGRLKNPKRIPYDWERVDPDDPDWPDWADPELDTIIRFIEGSRMIEPGKEYPYRNYLGEPEYEKTVVGLQREQPDRTSRSFLRQEQTTHLKSKGEAAGIYEETINLQGDLGIEAEVTVPDHLVEALVAASRDNLRSDTGEEE